MPSPVASPVAAALALLDQHREHTITVKATQARHDFFPLLESVLGNPGEVVEVEHKSLQGRALLVNAQFRDYVRQLEAIVRALLAPSTEAVGFQLAGSMSVAGDPGAIVDELRAAHGARSSDRFESV